MPTSQPPGRRFAVHPVPLAFAVAAFAVLADNGLLWRTVLEARPGRAWHDLLFVGSIAPVLVAIFGLALLPFAYPRLLKPLAALLLLLAAAVAHFADSYGTVIDRTMLASLAQTDVREAAELFDGHLALRLALAGLAPALLLWRVPLRRLPWRRDLLWRGGAAVACLLVVAAAGALFYKDYAFLLRSHRELRHMVNPAAALNAGVRYLAATPPGPPPALRRVAGTVGRGPAVVPARKPVLLVLVVGETARADHFSLNGYVRDTNPALARLPVVSYAAVSSCGTATAVSVPCMFSHRGQETFSDAAAPSEENLLDILARAGVGVLWLENNTGCKGVCARVPTERMAEVAGPALCADGECRDEAMLGRLERAAARAAGDTVVVMHQLGSHGPAYDRRYPDAFRTFRPVCRTVQLQDCARDEIVNAYDNTILYTDDLLARAIGMLEGWSDRFEAVLLYVSDHGESLGEAGIYLHGLPYRFAPEAQTHVPMVVWASGGGRVPFAGGGACLRAGAAQPHSHDDLFHTVLGAFDVRTALYRPELDLFARCRQAMAADRSGRPPAQPSP